VLLLGHVSRHDLVGHYRRADLVVMTSRSEGIPVVLMEAMSHAKLVLAPAITGIPELVDHGRTGFLYQPGDLADLTAKIMWISNRPDELADVGRAAAAMVSTSYNRRKNLRAFAEQFLRRVNRGGENADSLLQQVRLPV
jgi:glycosyltransferase involved in cell wall biosynthesis